jgi:predicted ArsR family transcriptional regulator
LSKRTPSLTAPELTAAMSHPTRIHLMTVLTERTASPKEIAQELDRPIRHITYHLGVLEQLDCVELVRQEQSMGGRVMEHFYKATQRPWLEHQSWDQLDDVDDEQPRVTSAIMELVSEDIAEAMSAGTFNDPPDNHLSRTPMTVDDEGWAEVASVLRSTLNRLLEIQGRVNARGARGDATMPIKVEIIHFRSPPPKPR